MRIAFTFIMVFIPFLCSSQTDYTRYVCKGDTIDCHQNKIEIKNILDYINSDRKAIFIKNAVIRGEVDFYNKSISVPVYFSNCIFQNKFKFDYANINNLITIKNCVFADTFGGEDFYFRAIKISNSTFNKAFILSNGIIRQYAYFESDSFGGFVDCAGTDFEKSLSFEKSKFNGVSEFINASCGGQVNFDSCRFSESCSFDQLKATGFAHFFGTVFQNVSFTGASFKYSFFLENAVFQNADFRDVSVNDNFSLDNSEFKANLTANSAKIGNSFYCSSVIVDSVGSFRNMSVDNQAVFNDSKFNQTVKFSNSFYKHFILRGTRFNSVYNIDGVMYDEIRTGRYCDSLRNCDSLNLALIANADYNYKNFILLEQFYRGQGDEDFANRVFYLAQKKEAETNGLAAKVLNWMSYTVIRNGKKPAGALALSVLIIALGYFVFRKREWMEIKDTSLDSNQPYFPLLYSFDLFIPFIDLYYKGIWRPLPKNKWRYNYVRIHTFLGWIIVPWLIAYWTGLVK